MKQQLRYSLILHNIRIELGLNLVRYCIADSIYHLSNNPDSKVQGWCYASKEHIARFLGVASRTVFSHIKWLIKEGLVEKDEETKYLRTTKKWYEKVVLMKMRKEYEEIARPMKKLHSGSEEVAHIGCEETSHYNNNINNNNNKERTPSQKMKLFLIDLEEPKRIARAISEKSNLTYENVLSELKNFAGYWSELNKPGTKQRWQLEKTFELRRRLGTWFKNAGKFNSNQKAKQLWNI